MKKKPRFRPGGFSSEERALSDEFIARSMPTTPIRKPTASVTELPLFNPNREQEAAQESAQQPLWRKS